MNPALIAYVDLGHPGAFDATLQRLYPHARLDRIHDAEGLAVRGSLRECAFAVDPNRKLTAIVAGVPAWDSSQSTLPLATIAQRLLDTYRDRGISAVEKLRNGFAAIIVDRERGQVHAAIDRIGRMPLAYGSTGSGICFATDARAVAHVVGDARLDPQAIYDYAFFHAVPSRETIFRGVRKLAPAERLTFESSTVTTSIYWRPEFTARGNASITKLGAEFLQCLQSAVAANEPNATTATFLSGGIDSSVVTGMVARTLGTGRPAYTIGFEQAGYDETGYAKIAAKHFGAELRIHYISTQEVSECIDELASLYDEPFGNSSAVPALVCTRLAKRDGIEKMFAGDGGDELFAGNTRYAKQRVFEAYSHVPAPVRSMVEAVFRPGSALDKTPLRKVGSYIQQARVPLPDRLEAYNFILREDAAKIFHADFLRQVDRDQHSKLMREQYHGVANAATLDRMLYLDWKFTLADNDLRKVVATSRHNGIDVRFPWLDDSVLEFSARVPATLKMRGTKLRYFAKLALSDFLPSEIIHKSKHGFGLPFGQWLKTDPGLQNQIYDLLSALRGRGVFQPKFIDRLIEEHRMGHAAYYGTMVWVLAIFEAWMEANQVSL